MFAQDCWKPRGNITVDYGVRYSLYPPITDANNVLTNFLPSAYVAANAPKCANAACTLIVPGTGDPLNGIIVAGKNSPFGDAIYAFDKGDIQPRIGVTWDPGRNGTDDLPQLVRRLLRPGARRHLRAELVHQPAVRQHGRAS